MQIIIAQEAGFCKGVQRAIDMAYALRKNGYKKVYTEGDLIHNKSVLKELYEAGIESLKGECSSEKDNNALLIRAHGISPERRDELQLLGMPLYDATCPDVGMIAGKIRHYSKKGYSILIFGDPKHPEVVGLMGYVETKGYVIQCNQDFDNIGLANEKICLVAQSTQTPEDFEAIAQHIAKSKNLLAICDTICQATKQRQAEISVLAQKGAQAIIVVGSANSANTQKLVAVARAHGLETFLLEGIKQLDEKMLSTLKKFSCVGITGGASAPMSAIQAIACYLQ